MILNKTREVTRHTWVLLPRSTPVTFSTQRITTLWNLTFLETRLSVDSNRFCVIRWVKDFSHDITSHRPVHPQISVVTTPYVLRLDGLTGVVLNHRDRTTLVVCTCGTVVMLREVNSVEKMPWDRCSLLLSDKKRGNGPISFKIEYGHK